MLVTMFSTEVQCMLTYLKAILDVYHPSILFSYISQLFANIDAGCLQFEMNA